MKKYKPVPISAAREIAKKYDKAQVIVVCWDAVHGKEHVTTYGVDKEQCRQAALGGDRVKAALGWDTRVICACGHPKSSHSFDGCMHGVDQGFCPCDIRPENIS